MIKFHHTTGSHAPGNSIPHSNRPEDVNGRDIYLLLLWKQFFLYYGYIVSHSYRTLQGQYTSNILTELCLISTECGCFVSEYLPKTEINTQITELKHTRVTKSWERKSRIRKLHRHTLTFLQLWPPFVLEDYGLNFLIHLGLPCCLWWEGWHWQSECRAACDARRTAPSTHTTTWNTCRHNTAKLTTMYFYWLIPQKCNFSQAQFKFPEDDPGGPKHVGAIIRYCKC